MFVPFQENLKIAKAVPIFWLENKFLKATDQYQSVLTYLSKFFEKVMHIRSKN